MSFIVLPIQFSPNTGFGVGALQTGAGSRNIAFGTDALKQITTTGEDNIAIGYRSGRFLTTQDGNVLVGSGTMENATGAFNIAVGLNALKGAISINQPSQNVAIGNEALFFTDSASQCVAIGQVALKTNNSGNSNVAVGYAAGYSNFRGESNVFIGADSGYNFQTSTLGEQTSNSFVGAGSGSQITTGRRNTILGRYNGNQGGLDIRTLNDYVVLSDGNGNPRLYIDGAGLVTAPGGFAGIGGGITLNNQTGAYTVVASDSGKAINCTANTFTVSLTAAATLGSGFACFVWNTGGGVITIDPNGAETIDGVSTIVLQQGEGTQIVCDGTNWLTGSKKTMRGYAENIPNGTPRASASGFRSFAIGSSSNAGGVFSIAIGTGSNSAWTSAIAIGTSVSANGDYQTGIGHNSGGQPSSLAANSGSMALGGSYASGTDSFAAAVANNTSSYGATGANSVAIGYRAKASNSYTFAAGWGIASGYGAICITNGVGQATGQGAVAIGGITHASASASGSESMALGDGANASLYGKMARANGQFSSIGDAQIGTYILRRATTNTTPTVLIADASTPGNANQVILPNNSAYAFTGTIIARQQAAGGTQSAAWKVEGLIRREANAGTTTLVASTVTVISNAPGWTLALSADTTNGGLAITATGAAATNIRWVGNINTSEVTYA